jgi:hypothetical protein
MKVLTRLFECSTDIRRVMLLVVLPRSQMKMFSRLFQAIRPVRRVMILLVFPFSKMIVFCPTFSGIQTYSAGDVIRGFTRFENENILSDFNQLRFHEVLKFSVHHVSEDVNHFHQFHLNQIQS